MLHRTGSRNIWQLSLWSSMETCPGNFYAIGFCDVLDYNYAIWYSGSRAKQVLCVERSSLNLKDHTHTTLAQLQEYSLLWNPPTKSILYQYELFSEDVWFWCFGLEDFPESAIWIYYKFHLVSCDFLIPVLKAGWKINLSRMQKIMHYMK